MIREPLETCRAPQATEASKIGADFIWPIPMPWRTLTKSKINEGFAMSLDHTCSPLNLDNLLDEDGKPRSPFAARTLESLRDGKPLVGGVRFTLGNDILELPAFVTRAPSQVKLKI